MLGGKQKFHGQSGFYKATMRVAVMKKVSGQRFQLDVLEELGLPVTDAMRARFAQIDAERDFKRNFLYANPKEAIKRLRRKAQLKHAAWRDSADADHSLFGVVRDHANRVVYWRSAINPSLQRLRLADADLATGATPRTLAVTSGPWFHDALQGAAPVEAA